MRRQATAIVAISAFVLLTWALGAMSASAATPVVSINPASSVSFTSAHLTGKVNPEDQEPFFYFQYSADPKGEGWRQGTFQGPLPSGSGETAVADDLTGLKPGTEYFARLVATNFAEEWFSNSIVSFKTDPVSAPTVSIIAPTSITSSSAHFKAQITPEGSDPAFNVHWHFQCTPTCPGLEGEVPAGPSQTVEADASGLKPGTPYEVTIVAVNDGSQEASAGPEVFTTATRAPEVLSTSVSALNDEATLKGQVDPGGLGTTYHFEYGTTASYGLSSPIRTISGGDPVSVQAPVFGLVPGSGYHFKLVAENAEGGNESADRAFSTKVAIAAQGNCPNEAIRRAQNSTYLPDCRAYEQISPVDKKGNGTAPSRSSIFALSSDGERSLFGSTGSFAGAGRVVVRSDFRSDRTPSGWVARPIDPEGGPSTTLFDSSMYVAGATPELRNLAFAGTASFNPFDDDPSTFPGFEELQATDVYLREDFGPLVWTSRGNTDQPDTSYEPVNWDGELSDDGSHAILQTTLRLVDPAVGPSPEPGVTSVYDRTRGHTYLLGLDAADGLVLPCEMRLPSIGFAGGVTSSTPGIAYSSLRPVSTDGSHVVIVVAPCPEEGGAMQLYMTGAGRESIRITRARDGLPEETSASPRFDAMARDGSSVLFSSASRLNLEAPAEPKGWGYLYRWDEAGEKLTYIAEAGMSEGNVFGASEDLSRYYISSPERLTEAAPVNDEEKLYLIDDGKPTFVTALGSGADVSPGEVSPDGGALAFTSRIDLTDQQTQGHEEVYLFTAGAGDLICASCPNGQASGDASFSTGLLPRRYLRNLSADGRYLFFESSERLVPEDSNDSEDVYEYDVQTGRVGLLSGGRGAVNSVFMSSSASGRDVMFSTTASLDPRDTDNGATDVYDARSGGGFDLLPAGQACSGESCQGVAASVSPSGAPGSATVVGAIRRKARKAHCRKAAHASAVKRKVRCGKPKRKKHSPRRGHAGHSR